MASLRRFDRPANGGNNRGHDRAQNEDEPQAIADPTFDGALSQEISEAAYFLAEARGFESGHELEDWIEAERQVVRSNQLAAEAARA